VKPRAYQQLFDQLASLPRRQRAGLAQALNCGLQQEKTVALIDSLGAAHACPRCRSTRLHRNGQVAFLLVGRHRRA
jgi:hypothetical protein